MNNTTLKESNPVFEPLPEVTESNAGQIKTSYPIRNSLYRKSEKIVTLSEQAIKASSEINLPDIKTKMKRTEEWRLAFNWYNQFIHKGSHHLGMGCHPCWDKVYAALKKAKS